MNQSCFQIDFNVNNNKNYRNMENIEENIYFPEIRGQTYGISIVENDNKLEVYLTDFLCNFWFTEVVTSDLPVKSKVRYSDYVFL